MGAHRGWVLGGVPELHPPPPGLLLPCRPDQAQAASLRGKGRPTPQQPSGVSKQKDLNLKAWP